MTLGDIVLKWLRDNKYVLMYEDTYFPNFTDGWIYIEQSWPYAIVLYVIEDMVMTPAQMCEPKHRWRQVGILSTDPQFFEKIREYIKCQAATRGAAFNTW